MRDVSKQKRLGQKMNPALAVFSKKKQSLHFVLQAAVPTLKVAVNTVPWYEFYLRIACFFGCSGSQKTLISCLRAEFIFFI